MAVKAPDQLGFRGFVIRGEGAGGETYRVNGDIVRIGGSPNSGLGREIQTYIVSMPPDDLKAMLLPLQDAR